MLMAAPNALQQLALVPPPQPKEVAKPSGQKRFAQGAAKAFEAFPKFTQVKGPGPQKLPLPELEKDAGTPRPACCVALPARQVAVESPGLVTSSAH